MLDHRLNSTKLVPRVLTAAAELFIGFGAAFGGYELLKDAEAFGLPEAWLGGSVFPDYRVPGLFLMVVLGFGMLGAAVAALLGSRYWPLAAVGMATTLAAWLVIETAVI